MTKLNPRTNKPVSPKGLRRRESILDAAEKLLIEEGYAEFSIRKLADRLSIRLYNVQYYFPTLNTVIDALFTRTLDSARKELEAGANGDLQSLVSYVLATHNSASSCLLFWELWTVSARDPDVSQTLQRFYEVYRDAIEDCIKALEPRLSSSSRRRRAILIMSLLEGLSLFRGYGRELKGTGPALDRDIQDAVLMLTRLG